ncbi:MAG: hypothetical protein SFT68_01620 [Rickettsiaceae bacterium]|nr:hypothetical protein [Rickettsiaceae bacterium]
MSFPRSISLSFPRRWESSLTISWIPFFKGMTTAIPSHSRAVTNPVLPFPGSPFSRG